MLMIHVNIRWHDLVNVENIRIPWITPYYIPPSYVNAWPYTWLDIFPDNQHQCNEKSNFSDELNLELIYGG
jgi:hypothetical protein